LYRAKLTIGKFVSDGSPRKVLEEGSGRCLSRRTSGLLTTRTEGRCTVQQKAVVQRPLVGSSSTVGPRDQFSFLRARDNQIKLSTFATVAFRVRRRPDRFHARRRAPPLHSFCQKFGNTDYFFKLPAKATMSRFDETMVGSPVISCEGREVLQRTRVRQVFRRG
jgi:hypothetical protein